MLRSNNFERQRFSSSRYCDEVLRCVNETANRYTREDGLAIEEIVRPIGATALLCRHRVRIGAFKQLVAKRIPVGLRDVEIAINALI